MLTHDLTTRPAERPRRLAAPDRKPEPHQIVLYPGGNVLRNSHRIRTVSAIFDRLGLDYVALGGPPSGGGHRPPPPRATPTRPTGWTGARSSGFQRYKPEEVVMWCPSCIYFYDEIQRFSWPVPVRRATEFLAARLAELEVTGRVEAGVALHSRRQSEPRRQEGAAARRLLEAVAGLRFVEIGSAPLLGRLGPPRRRRRSARRSGTRWPAARSPGRGRAAAGSSRRSITGASG